MTDQEFPLICYPEGKSFLDWGRAHGEQFRAGIRELAQIRRDLMQERNSQLTDSVIEREAEIQYQVSQSFAPHLTEELDGICQGSGVSQTDIVVLNNYTDFRDLHFSDGGCSTVFVEHKKSILAGQTWDMHSSAKNYVCVLRVPSILKEHGAENTYLFSLVGCVGMMGFNPKGGMIGVNNLNGSNAKSGIIWPILVRSILEQSDLTAMNQIFETAKVTSAHAYLFADAGSARLIELFPECLSVVGEHKFGTRGSLFHTNHCVTADAKQLESEIGTASTTIERYELLKKKIGGVKDFDGLVSLLTDHDNYPRSICSHYESGAHDPSFTCGGAVGDLRSGKLKFWRGCPEKDSNYREFFLSTQGN